MVGYNHPQPPTQARPVKLESPTGADSPHPPPPPGSAGQGRNNVNDFGQGQQGAGGGNGGQQPILNTSELIISGMSLTNLDVNTGERRFLSSEVILTTPIYDESYINSFSNYGIAGSCLFGSS